MAVSLIFIKYYRFPTYIHTHTQNRNYIRFAEELPATRILV